MLTPTGANLIVQHASREANNTGLFGGSVLEPVPDLLSELQNPGRRSYTDENIPLGRRADDLVAATLVDSINAAGVFVESTVEPKSSIPTIPFASKEQEIIATVLRDLFQTDARGIYLPISTQQATRLSDAIMQSSDLDPAQQRELDRYVRSRLLADDFRGRDHSELKMIAGALERLDRRRESEIPRGTFLSVIEGQVQIAMNSDNSQGDTSDLKSEKAQSNPLYLYHAGSEKSAA